VRGMSDGGSPFAKQRHALLPVEEQDAQRARRRKQQHLATALATQLQQQSDQRRRQQRHQHHSASAGEGQGVGPAEPPLDQVLRRQTPTGTLRRGVLRRDPNAPALTAPSPLSAAVTLPTNSPPRQRGTTPPQERMLQHAVAMQQHSSSPGSPGSRTDPSSSHHPHSIALSGVWVSAERLRRLEQLAACRHDQERQLDLELDHITQGMSYVAKQQAVHSESMQSLAQQVVSAVAGTTMVAEQQQAMHEQLNSVQQQLELMARHWSAASSSSSSPHPADWTLVLQSLRDEAVSVQRRLGEVEGTLALTAARSAAVSTSPSHRGSSSTGPDTADVRLDNLAAGLDRLHADANARAQQMHAMQAHLVSVEEELRTTVSAAAAERHTTATRRGGAGGGAHLQTERRLTQATRGLEELSASLSLLTSRVASVEDGLHAAIGSEDEEVRSGTRWQPDADATSAAKRDFASTLDAVMAAVATLEEDVGRRDRAVGGSRAAGLHVATRIDRSEEEISRINMARSELMLEQKALRDELAQLRSVFDSHVALQQRLTDDHADGTAAQVEADLLSIRKRLELVEAARLAEKSRVQDAISNVEEKQWSDVQALEERIAVLEQTKRLSRANSSQAERDIEETKHRLGAIESTVAQEVSRLRRLDAKLSALERSEGSRVTEARLASQRTDKLAKLATELASLATTAPPSTTK
jgi:hypothetical protein